MIEHEEGNVVVEEDVDRDGELLSGCCGWSPASEPVGDNGNKGDDIIALCSKCKDWSGFYYEDYYDKTE